MNENPLHEEDDGLGENDTGLPEVPVRASSMRAKAAKAVTAIIEGGTPVLTEVIDDSGDVLSIWKQVVFKIAEIDQKGPNWILVEGPSWLARIESNTWNIMHLLESQRAVYRKVSLGRGGKTEAIAFDPTVEFEGDTMGNWDAVRLRHQDRTHQKQKHRAIGKHPKDIGLEVYGEEETKLVLNGSEHAREASEKARAAELEGGATLALIEDQSE